MLAKVPTLDTEQGRSLVQHMVALAELTRTGFSAGDVSTIISRRTVIGWAENTVICRDVWRAFELTVLNRVDEDERALYGVYWQRAMGDTPEES